MPAAIDASQVLAFLAPREDLRLLPRRLAAAPRALPVNGRTIVVPHEAAPEAGFTRELDVVIGPAGGDGPFHRVQVHSIGVTELTSTAFLSWARLTPATGISPALDPDPWDGDSPLAAALQRLPARLADEGVAGFWAEAVAGGLATEPEIDAATRKRFGAAAVADLAVSVRPVVATVAAPTGWRWRFWPPSFW